MSTPVISNESTQDFNAEGYPLILSCSVELRSGEETPVGSWLKDGETIKESNDVEESSVVVVQKVPLDNFYQYKINLTISSTTKNNDEGNYTCIMKNDNKQNSASTKIRLLEKDTHFVQIEEEDPCELSVYADTMFISWSVTVNAFPRATVEWLDTHGKSLAEQDRNKYTIQNSGTYHTLWIRNIQFSDIGNYTIIAKNAYMSNSSSLSLFVTGKPLVAIDINSFHLVDQNDTATCTVWSYQKPNIQWAHKNCQHDTCAYKQVLSTQSTENEIKWTSVVTINANQSGTVKCTASNSLGPTELIRDFRVVGLKPTALTILNPRNQSFEDDHEYISTRGDYPIFTCIGYTLVNWTNTNNGHIAIKTYVDNDYHYVAELAIYDVDTLDVGTYKCEEFFTNKELSVYLYVVNASSLTVANKSVILPEFQPLVIPCLPTAPDIYVELYEDYVKQIIIGRGDGYSKFRAVDWRFNYWTYNPQIGFTSYYLNRQSDNTYYCRYFDSNVVKQSKYIDVIRTRKYGSIGTPIMWNEGNQDYNAEGYPLILHCATRLHSKSGSYLLRNSKWLWMKDGKNITESDGVKIAGHRNKSRTISTSLTISSTIKNKDEGNYTCIITGSLYQGSASMKIKLLEKKTRFLHIKDIARMYKQQPFEAYAGDSSILLEVEVCSFPKATIEWFDTNNKPIVAQNTGKFGMTSLKTYHSLEIRNIQLSDAGNYTILATNSYMSNASSIVLSVLSKPLIEINVKNFNLAGQENRVTCTVFAYPEPNIYLAHKNCQNDSCSYKQVLAKQSRDTSKWTSTVTINTTQSGFVKCTANNSLGTTESFREFIVSDLPKILDTNLNNSTTNLLLPTAFSLYCLVGGVPKPNISWIKDGEYFKPANHVLLRNGSQELYFNKSSSSDEGKYECIVGNKHGEVRQSALVEFSNKGDLSPLYYSIVTILLPICIGMAIWYCHKVRRDGKWKSMIKAAGLDNFEKGQVESINLDLGIDDQAEFLPYNKDRWEIPREKIKIGKQLGAGSFGVVMEAVIYNFAEDKESETVAVKMAKRHVDFSYLKALCSELKIMSRLGCHLNVVNLIGACTCNIMKQELLVVLEFCRLGNIHNYLLKHRADFIDQIDSATDTIDDTIGAEILEWSFSTTSISQDGMTKAICTKDLLIWAFQVSRGMDYLASRKILHGDLAARNILLADNNIVKISDFGLARRMYADDNYKKKNDCPLPIKWMAIECIADRVFSTQSDVWSYGIVLWEFFALAKTPYPGMEADEKLYHSLVNGYRMESPQYATKDIYKIMIDCWQTDPTRRPTFRILIERVGNMIEKTILKHYIDLNDPYLKMNMKLLELNQRDKVPMESPSDFAESSQPYSLNDDDSDTENQPNLVMTKLTDICDPETVENNEVMPSYESPESDDIEETKC